MKRFIIFIITAVVLASCGTPVCECTVETVYYEFPEMNSKTTFSAQIKKNDICEEVKADAVFYGGYYRTTCVKKIK